MKIQKFGWPVLGLALLLSGCNPSQQTQQTAAQPAAQKPTSQASAQASPAPAITVPIAKPQAATSAQAPVVFPPGATAQLTRNIYLVLDGSGSMGGQKYVDAKKAITNYLSKVGDDVNLGLWIFDSAGNKERVPLGPGNKGKVLKAVQESRSDNTTPLGSSIKAGAEKLRAQYLKQLGYGEFFLLVITDGAADGNDPVGPAVKVAARYGIPLFTIGYQLSSEHELKKYSTAYREATDAEGLEKALADFLPEK